MCHKVSDKNGQQFDVCISQPWEDDSVRTDVSGSVVERSRMSTEMTEGFHVADRIEIDFS